MAAKTDAETNACVILWKIQNVSHCCLKRGEEIKSPTFIADALISTTWSLWLLPIGTWYEHNVELRLHREKDCCGPDEIDVNYKLAFLSEDGSVLAEKEEREIFSKEELGYSLRENRRKVFVTDREVFLPDDILTVQCTIWNGCETPVKPEEIYTQTVLKVKRRSFVWKIHKFSTLKPGAKNTFKDNLIAFDFVLKEELDFDEKLALNGITFNESVKYFLLKISVINSDGKKEYLGSHEYFEDDIKKGILPKLLSSRTMIENKSRYLPNDILTLDCEYLYSTGTIADHYCSYGIMSRKETKVNVEEANTHAMPVLVNDLKSMYTDSIFSDTEIRTSTKTFSAHKGILSVRSPVFRRMFSNDMKENNTGRIEIDDLEEDTVNRMLLYIYTDSLEGLQFENACKLYVAADKYEILPLKTRCASFLTANLCPTNVCDILVLADRHHDEDLKNAAHDFIVKHDEVFSLQEWKHLMATNLQLAADIMYRKIYPDVL